MISIPFVLVFVGVMLYFGAKTVLGWMRAKRRE